MFIYFCTSNSEKHTLMKIIAFTASKRGKIQILFLFVKVSRRFSSSKGGVAENVMKS